MIMLAESVNSQKIFDPFNITLSVNNIRDAQSLYFIFNFLPIIDGVFDSSGNVVELSAKMGEIRQYILQKSPRGMDLTRSFDEFKIGLQEQMKKYLL